MLEMLLFVIELLLARLYAEVTEHGGHSATSNGQLETNGQQMETAGVWNLYGPYYSASC